MHTHAHTYMHAHGHVHTLTYEEVRYQDLAHVVMEAENSQDQQLAGWSPGLAKGLVPVHADSPRPRGAGISGRSGRPPGTAVRPPGWRAGAPALTQLSCSIRALP